MYTSFTFQYFNVYSFKALSICTSTKQKILSLNSNDYLYYENDVKENE